MQNTLYIHCYNAWLWLYWNSGLQDCPGFCNPVTHIPCVPHTYASNFIDDNNNVTKKLWSFVKTRKQDYIGIGPLKYQDSTITDSLSKANVLTDYFSSVFSSEDIANVPVLEGHSLSEISLIHIHADGVTQLLLNLKTHKAASPDNFPFHF